ncbi:maleylpyruvate isomerase family mycothiol-dependent enzyme [Glutamicibacter sp. NPDC087344]|uniref:maleylpyruvate isomerase family mycothiol-dependent enzyme n=1 Tax=Glutamicibacter sp. NPDC087344 TaxID=3363994 RepID=UPI003803BEA3
MTQLLAPAALITQVTTSLDELRAQLRGVDFQDYPKPSSLPGWSISQLIAHLASFAKAARRQFGSVGASTQPEMYDGGQAGRIEAINMTALMRPEALLELTTSALAELREVLPETENHWEESVGYRPGAKVADMMYATWREMLIHATDLNEFVRPASSWPAEFSEHLFRALSARVPAQDRLVLQPHGKSPVILGAGEKSWVLSGTEFDLAAWLAGRPAAGPVQATAAADASDYPSLLPWPSDRLMNR